MNYDTVCECGYANEPHRMINPRITASTPGYMVIACPMCGTQYLVPQSAALPGVCGQCGTTFYSPTLPPHPLTGTAPIPNLPAITGSSPTPPQPTCANPLMGGTIADPLGQRQAPETKAQFDARKRAAGWKGSDSMPFDSDYD